MEPKSPFMRNRDLRQRVLCGDNPLLCSDFFTTDTHRAKRMRCSMCTSLADGRGAPSHVTVRKRTSQLGCSLRAHLCPFLGLMHTVQLSCCLCHVQLALANNSGVQATLPVQETGIAWKSDVKKKFGNQSAEWFNTAEYAALRGGGTITGTVCHC